MAVAAKGAGGGGRRKSFLSLVFLGENARACARELTRSLNQGALGVRVLCAESSAWTGAANGREIRFWRERFWFRRRPKEGRRGAGETVGVKVMVMMMMMCVCVCAATTAAVDVTKEEKGACAIRLRRRARARTHETRAGRDRRGKRADRARNKNTRAAMVQHVTHAVNEMEERLWGALDKKRGGRSIGTGRKTHARATTTAAARRPSAAAATTPHARPPLQKTHNRPSPIPPQPLSVTLSSCPPASAAGAAAAAAASPNTDASMPGRTHTILPPSS